VFAKFIRDIMVCSQNLPTMLLVNELTLKPEP